jgi:hypothetical protein
VEGTLSFWLPFKFVLMCARVLAKVTYFKDKHLRVIRHRKLPLAPYCL